MSSYSSLAAWYDQLTGDVPYQSFADFYETEFARVGGEFRLLLDFCCGTGTLTAELTRRGYEMIGVDASVDMLMQAQDKCASLPTPPLFLHQRAEELDLYGTVDAAICSLDGMNYLAPELLPEVFRRLHLFVRPGGLVLFDVHLPLFSESDRSVIFPGMPGLLLGRIRFMSKSQTDEYSVQRTRMTTVSLFFPQLSV